MSDDKNTNGETTPTPRPASELEALRIAILNIEDREAMPSHERAAGYSTAMVDVITAIQQMQSQPSPAVTPETIGDVCDDCGGKLGRHENGKSWTCVNGDCQACGLSCVRYEADTQPRPTRDWATVAKESHLLSRIMAEIPFSGFLHDGFAKWHEQLLPILRGYGRLPQPSHTPDEAAVTPRPHSAASYGGDVAKEIGEKVLILLDLKADGNDFHSVTGLVRRILTAHTPDDAARVDELDAMQERCVDRGNEIKELRDRLQKIAEQHKSDEWEEEGDTEAAYDAIIDIARSALSRDAGGA